MSNCWYNNGILTLEVNQMGKITIYDVPQELHQQLKDDAQQHRRSMNQQILFILEKYFASTTKPTNVISPYRLNDYTGRKEQP